MMNQESARFEHGSGCELVSVLGDITVEKVGAIVNAANTRLAHGGGVAGAISRKGGPEIQRESLSVAPVNTGSAAITTAGRLPCGCVIHAVGPVWGGGRSGEPGLLASAVRSALELAHQEGLTSISFPAISAGIFGFPAPFAVQTIVGAVCDFLDNHPNTPIRQCRFCNIDTKLVELFDRELEKLGANQD